MNDHHRDFEGGRFIFVDENVAENRTTFSSIEPKKGRVSVFTSGAENVHHIEKVEKGTRYAYQLSHCFYYMKIVIKKKNVYFSDTQ